MLSRTVIHHSFLAKSGGATKVAAMLHDGLLKSGHKSIHSFEASEEPGDKLILPEEAAQSIPEGNIVHLHSSAAPALFLRKLPARTKTVITLHDTKLITGGCASPMGCVQFEEACSNCPRNFPDSKRSRRDKISALIESKAVLVSPSGWLARLARKADPALKPRIIPNGTTWPDKPADRKAARKELGIHHASRVLLFIAHGGAKAAYKSGPEWKQYWLEIKKAVPEALCFAIGGNSNSRDGDFISIPYVQNDMLNKFLCAADVLAYPTLGDNHPLIIIEAMAQSLPAVSYAVGGVVEQISDGENGILVAPYEKKTFTEKVSILLKNSRLAREMGSRGFHTGKKRFSSERVLGDYTKLYYSLV
ncbi:glycosyltransferase [Maridesulfovibrio sp.]|uniref:glycosyltransferase n=1 Tax=Maridesulfovibrio sp. TaxID=2795000 RepID=UPI0039F12460